MLPGRAVRVVATLVLALVARAARAQEGPGVALPVPSLIEIAQDFDAGRNPMYCYFGRREIAPELRVLVDSVTRITTPAQCRGIGIGFVTRIDDPMFMAQVLRGLILSNADFVVASAFYRTEDVEHGGERIHAARALSVLRGVETLVRRNGS